MTFILPKVRYHVTICTSTHRYSFSPRLLSRMFYVYVLQSHKDKSWYIGYTKDLNRRIKQHNRGESIHTRKHLPYILICYFALPNKKDAKRYEKYLKSGYGRRTIKKILKEYLSM